MTRRNDTFAICTEQIPPGPVEWGGEPPGSTRHHKGPDGDYLLRNGIWFKVLSYQSILPTIIRVKLPADPNRPPEPSQSEP